MVPAAPCRRVFLSVRLCFCLSVGLGVCLWVCLSFVSGGELWPQDCFRRQDSMCTNTLMCVSACHFPQLQVCSLSHQLPCALLLLSCAGKPRAEARRLARCCVWPPLLQGKGLCRLAKPGPAGEGAAADRVSGCSLNLSCHCAPAVAAAGTFDAPGLFMKPPMYGAYARFCCSSARVLVVDCCGSSWQLL